MDFDDRIRPFSWEESFGGGFSVCLDAGDYRSEFIDSYLGSGFDGSGYDWESLAKVFLEEKLPHLIDGISFDSDSDIFCARSESAETMREFIINFKEACDDSEILEDLLSMAEYT